MVEGGLMSQTPMPEMKKAEMAGKEEQEKPKTGAEAKQVLDALTEALRKIEAQTLSGVAVLTPREVLLDLSDLQAKHPDRHFRWVNIQTPGTADRRRLDGYIRLPESEGGKEMGREVAVFVTTKRIHEQREARVKKMNRERLNAHKAEMENVAEGVVRELRDRYGLKLDLNRILVND
jgi:hypothetical protein